MSKKKQVKQGSGYLHEKTITGIDMQEIDTANMAMGVLPMVFPIVVTGGAASADFDLTMLFACRVIKAWAHLEGAGTTSDTLQLKSTANAITEALDISTGADHDEIEFTSFDNAYNGIASGGILRVSAVDGSGTDRPACKVYVMVVRT